MKPVPVWLAGLYTRIKGTGCPHQVESICPILDDVCLELFPYQEHIQEELVGGEANLRALRLALMECKRDGEEALETFIEGMTSFYWPK